MGAARSASDQIVDIELKRWVEPATPSDPSSGGVVYLMLLVTLAALAVALIVMA